MNFKNIFCITGLILSLQISSQNTYNHHLEFAQEKINERQELYFHFHVSEIESAQTVKELSNIISIDGIKNNKVYAYANPDEFELFLEFGLDFEPVYEYYNQAKNLTMATTVSEMADWDRYPTFAVYEQMMNDFATDYPEMARLDTIGFSVNGYPILCIVISSNVNTPADKPKYWWSSNMHGDELAGYVILLRLADYLLSNYGDDSQVTNLLDNTYIYIDPLANPDGTYFNSPDYDDVSGSRRNNANNVDLNRNYPYIEGSSPATQIEAQIAMDYAQEHGFTMSANAHGGIELINYPWDFWNSAENPHADDNWWQYVSYMYADLAQANSPPGYFTGQGDGVTHGGDWYVVDGSRQDWMNYYSNVREVTLEWHDTKKLPAADLPAHWDYNEQAILDYTEQILYGFRGIITDACTEEPIIGAKVEIVSHDKDNSEVYSFDPIGNYHRLIYEGTYEVTFSADGYHDFVTTVNVENNQSTRVDIELYPDNVALPDFTASETNIFEGESVNFTNLTSGSVSSYNWIFAGGNPSESTDENPTNINYPTEGFYNVTLEIESNGCVVNNEKTDYIKVFEPQEPLADFVADNTEVPAGTSVNFTDISLNVPDSWSWTFEGGTPNSSTDQNPEVFYDNPGIYDVSLIASNIYGENEVVKTDYITVGLPEACNAGGINTNFMFIEEFSLNTINNPSNASQYSDFTNISTDLIIGESYDFYVNAGEAYDWNQCLIWIDWNGDGVFDEEDEEVYRSEIENAVEYNGTIQVPENLNAGSVRLRVRIQYNRDGFDPNDTPCGFSGYGEVEDYTVNLIVPDVPPTADFSANISDYCTGEVQFTGLSTYAETWEWDFGDGNLSSLQNPTHIYSESGIYTVSLTVTNSFGTDTHSIDDYIDINIPEEPITTGDESCGESEITLYATGTGTLNWYDDPIVGNLINQGNSYTDYFSNTTTYYVASLIEHTSSFNLGNINSFSSGDYHTNNNYFIEFSAIEDFTLVSVELNSDGAGEKTIELFDSEDNLIETANVNVPDGISRVDLNFDISPGEYSLRSGDDSPNLWRNDADVNYPYLVDNIVSITNSNAGEDYYYFYYDWEIEVAEQCISEKVPVTATIHDIPEINLGEDIEQCGGSVILDAGEGFELYYWDGNLGTQTLEVNETGYVSVIVEDINGCTASDNIGIIIYPDISVDLIITDESTQGAEDGSIIAEVIGGTEPFDYFWNNDEESETIENLSSGIYSLTVVDSNNCEAQASGEVFSGDFPAPIADFSVNNSTGCDELTVQFTDNSLNDPNTWLWSFGDGNTSEDQNPQHTYTDHGVYSVTLSVSNLGGADDVTFEDLIVVGETPELTMSMTQESDEDMEDGTASVSVSSSYDYTVEWDTGHNTETVENLSAGLYCVTVTSILANCLAEDCVEVTTQDTQLNPPIADFAADQTDGCNSITVQFTDLSENMPDSWIWDFGNGYGSVMQNPVHTYEQPGQYTVSLTVSNDDGTDIKTTENYITLGETPEIDFEVTHESSAGQEDGEITVLISGGMEPYSIVWSNNETTQTISSLSSGLYSVLVTEAYNCSKTAATQVMIATNISKSNSSELDVYPNPAKDILNIKSENKVDKILILDALGKTIITKYPNQKIIEIGLSDLSTGIYFLKIVSDNNISTKKIVIQ